MLQYAAHTPTAWAIHAQVPQFSHACTNVHMEKPAALAKRRCQSEQGLALRHVHLLALLQLVLVLLALQVPAQGCFRWPE
mmetsp:Transcript_34989/g.77835  ORF Transcript_34989/g.77835 Transcript_34989/m.77835 type:complete len:80 (-) Transcript_34989:1164-1403(-)